MLFVFSELEMESCIICKELCIKDCVQVGPKGRTTLVAASHERHDGRHGLLQKQEPLTLHIACSKAYTRESSIKSEKRKSEESAADEEFKPPTLMSRTPSLDITTHCLFCSEVLLTSSKLETKHRKLTSNVETIEFKNSVLKRATEIGDKWGEMVAKRIEANIDLVAAEGKYHHACAQEFLSNPEKLKLIGKLVDVQRNSAFSELCAYLDDNNECQYAVSDLMKHMETFLNGEKGYSLKYFKQKLKENYKDDIIITSLPGKSSIVSFRDSVHRIFHERLLADQAAGKACENERIGLTASIIRDEIRLLVYDLSEYPTSEETENGTSIIPESLKLLLLKFWTQRAKMLL